MDALESHLQSDYKYGFVTDIETDDLAPGLSEDIIRAISAKKGEPEWMTEWRLGAYRKWLTMEEPTHWPNLAYEPVDYEDIELLLRPQDGHEDRVASTRLTRICSRPSRSSASRSPSRSA